MSQLHRALLAQIIAGMEPVVEAAVTALVPGGAAVAAAVHVGAEAAENIADAVTGGAAPDPAPAAPAPAAPVAPAPAAPAAPAPGSAAELALALSQVLAKYLPQ